MGRQKYYVVIVGRAVGVFDNWLEVASLVSGVSGALHESFATKEQAVRVFNEQREEGNTRVVDGPAPLSARNTRVASPAASANSSPPTPPRSPTRSNASLPRTSLPRMRSAPSPPSHSQSRQRSAHKATPTRARSRSPAVIYENVSYTRGASSTPKSSPRDARRATPRVVEASIELASYPSDTDSTTSASSGQEFSPSTRHIYGGRVQASPHRHTPSSPFRSKERSENRTPRAASRVTVGTPPGLRHYPDEEEYVYAYYTPMSTVSKGVQASSPLSPISSPKLRTPKDAPVNTPGSRSSKSSSSSSLRKSSSASSAIFSPKMPPSIPYPPVNIYLVCPAAHQSHCHCADHPIQYAATPASRFGLSHPMDIPSVIQSAPEIDPRSPVSRSGSAHSVLFKRPSPHVKLEEQMGNIYL